MPPGPLAGDLGGGLPAQFRVRPDVIIIVSPSHEHEPDPHLLTRAERLQYEGFKRRQNADDMIRTLLLKGTSIKAIVRATGYARKTVRQVDRRRRPGARLRSQSCRAFPSDDQATNRLRPRHVDRRSPRNAVPFVRQWAQRRLGCCKSRHHRPLVQRTNGRTNHQAKARQTANVRTRKARPSSSATHATLRSARLSAPKVSQSPFCTPITPRRGCLLHADPHSSRPFLRGQLAGSFPHECMFGPVKMSHSTICPILT